MSGSSIAKRLRVLGEGMRGGTITKLREENKRLNDEIRILKGSHTEQLEVLLDVIDEKDARANQLRLLLEGRSS